MINQSINKVGDTTLVAQQQLVSEQDQLYCAQQANIEFEKLVVTVPGRGASDDCQGPAGKTILHGISGAFRTGQLSAIMGPSGAGKSTLMNILAGYSNYGTNGIVRINGKRRDLGRFRKKSCYIMQQDQVPPNLTVHEVMLTVAALKLKCSTPADERNALIDNIIDTLGLRECLHTRTQDLSGGQRKRLVIAQELVNNKPIMFLDEPTSGLDSATCLQCITMLKKLASGGRTIICSIHQPSARIFEMFDQVYMLANGRCIYRGAVHALVQYFSMHNFVCPPYHNPADFITEIASGQYGQHVVDKFASIIAAADEAAVEQRQQRWHSYYVLQQHQQQQQQQIFSDNNNTKAIKFTAHNSKLPSDDLFSSGMLNNAVITGNGLETKSTVPDLYVDLVEIAHRQEEPHQQLSTSSKPPPSYERSVSTHSSSTSSNNSSSKSEFPTSYWKQFAVLTHRTFRSIYRDATLTRLRLAAHVVVGIVLGLLYYDIGNESSKILNNSSLLFFSMLFVLFAAMMPTIIIFPLEVNCVLREHLNYWYSLKPYCLAKLVADAPFQCVLPAIYGCIVYWLSGQPHELFRLGLFLVTLIATALVAQSVGFLIGACITSTHNAVFCGPITAIPMLLFSGFFINLDAIPPYLHWLSYFSYIRFSFEAALHAIYGYQRGKLNCTENPADTYSICFWSDGREFLRYMNVEHASFWFDIIILLGYFLALRLATYFALKLRFKWSRMIVMRAPRFRLIN